MSKVIKYLPELEGEEQVFVAQLYKDLGEEQAIQFANVYRQRRKDATTTLLMTVLGFIGALVISARLHPRLGLPRMLRA